MDRDLMGDLSRERIAEARFLLDAERWSGAYYLAGYAVELALEAAIVDRIAREPSLVFSEKRFSDRCRTHNLENLLALAGWDEPGSNEVDAAGLVVKWKIVTEWSEQSR